MLLAVGIKRGDRGGLVAGLPPVDALWGSRNSVRVADQR